MSEPVPPTSADRLLNAIRALIRAEFPTFSYVGIYEYSVDATDGTTVDCSPTDTSIPLPALSGVPMRSSVSGTTAKPRTGQNCLVMFVNGDPTRPIVFGNDPLVDTVSMDAATEVNIGNGTLGAARVTDAIQAGPFSGTIVQGSLKTKIG